MVRRDGCKMEAGASGLDGNVVLIASEPSPFLDSGIVVVCFGGRTFAMRSV